MMEAYDDSNSGGGTLLSTRLNRFCEEEDSGLDGIIIPDDNLSDEDSGSKFRDLSALCSDSSTDFTFHQKPVSVATTTEESSGEVELGCATPLKRLKGPDGHPVAVLQEEEQCQDRKIRRRKSRSSVLHSDLFGPRSVKLLLERNCCFLKCLQNFTPSEIERHEEEMCTKRWSERLCHMQAIVRYQRTAGTSFFQSFAGEEPVEMIRVLGKIVCTSAFKWIYRVNDNLWRTLMSDKPDLPRIHGNLGSRRISNTTDIARRWIMYFKELFGEKLPHCDDEVIAAFKHKTGIYEQYCWECKYAHLERQGDGGTGNKIKKRGGLISPSQFYRILRKDFPNLKVGKGTGMAYCSDCSYIAEKRKIAARSGNPKDLELANKYQVKHRNQAKVSRKRMNTKKKDAIHAEFDQDCIMIDGMDQAKTNLPHFSKMDKETAASVALRTHITGVILYTEHTVDQLVEGDEQPIMYYDFSQCGKGSNLTVAILLEALLKKRTPIRRKLWLQLDNTCAENKNRYVLSLCGLLVHLRIYDEVVLAFHPVGHTHCEVDRMFSRVSYSCLGRDIPTLKCMVEKLGECYTPHPEVLPIPKIFDFAQWIKQFIPSEFKGLQDYHVFELRRHMSEEGEEEVRMRWKHFEEDENTVGPWVDPNGYWIFEEQPDLSVPIKEVVPTLPLSDDAKETDQYMKTVAKSELVAKKFGKPVKERNENDFLSRKNFRDVLPNKIPSSYIHRLKKEECDEWDRFWHQDWPGFLKAPDVAETVEWQLTKLIARVDKERRQCFSADKHQPETSGECEAEASTAHTKLDRKLQRTVLGRNTRAVQIGRQGKLYRRRVNSGGETVRQEIAKDVLVVVQPAKSALPKGSKTEDLVDEPWVGIVKFVKKTAGVVTSVHFCWLYPPPQKADKLNGIWNQRRVKADGDCHPDAVMFWSLPVIVKNKTFKGRLPESIRTGVEDPSYLQNLKKFYGELEDSGPEEREPGDEEAGD